MNLERSWYTGRSFCHFVNTESTNLLDHMPTLRSLGAFMRDVGEESFMVLLGRDTTRLSSPTLQ